jgi:nucleoside-diphosphate-sugar epimerase
MIKEPLHLILGSGPLGQSIAMQLAATGSRVRMVSRKGDIHLPGVETVRADISKSDEAVAVSTGASIIYQCAAPAYQDWSRHFEALQENAIQAAMHAGAVLVVAENLYGYGVAGHLLEGMPLSASTRKGAVRARMTKRLFKAHEAGDIQAVAGRASDFFGPGVRMSALGERFWPQLLKGKTIDWFGDADRLHTFTYLPDFARALITLGSSADMWGRAWHVPSPETLTVRQVTERAATLAGLPQPRLRRTPKLMLRLIGLAIPAAAETVEMEYSWVQDFIMRQDAWNARFGQSATPWDEALLATLAAFRGNANNGSKAT